MNIFQKLIEVRKTCPYLKKDKDGFQFKYVSSSQALGALRGAMDEQGLLLIPQIKGYEVKDHTTKKGEHEYFTVLPMVFTWVNAENPEEKIECAWNGQGLDSGEKGIGKAVTYAEKYFLLKFFNVATDKLDPDAFQAATDKATPAPLKLSHRVSEPPPEAPRQFDGMTDQQIIDSLKVMSQNQSSDKPWNVVDVALIAEKRNCDVVRAWFDHYKKAWMKAKNKPSAPVDNKSAPLTPVKR
jgi:hypothetical protein